MSLLIVTKLAEGADSARGDDAALLKTRVVSWLSEKELPQPRLSLSDKVGRGFHNDSTARLICPVDYDWDKPEHRVKIQDWDPKYLKHTYNPDEPAKGLFKGSMLVRAFKAIFTSPSSADDEDQPPNLTKRRRGERRTRTNMASLVAMESVEPRAIAYAAVQLRFALSSCGTWRLVDGLFDHAVFYHNIVRWFEETEGSTEKAFVSDLLLWWNRYGNHSH
ncbi:hypothetical protein J3R83DRAFT_10041 [Lanmaoa asiatica]|nr:hypothetical protein J3R83DRAFT_10041 [Lanmaoa asiatica]